MATTNDLTGTGEVLPAQSGTLYAANSGPVLPQAGTVTTDAGSAPNGAVKYAPPAVQLVDKTTTTQAASVTANGQLLALTGGTSKAAIAAGTAANTVVKASAGVLCKVLVTATGTNPMQIFDNATTNSGVVIGALPASPAIGTVLDLQMPASAGITVGGSASNPGVTISFI